METNGNRFECLTILFVPNDGLENMTSLQVLADELRGRGHKTIFALNMTANEMMISNNEFKDLDEIVTQTSVNTELDFDYKVFELSEMEIFEKFSLKCLWKKLAQNKQRDDYYRELIERTEPHILIIESLLCCPSLTDSGIPWVSLNFGAPNQFLNDDRLPPAGSGLSFLSQRFAKHKWTQFKDKKNQLISELWHQLNDWCISKGSSKLPNNSLNKPSPYFNVYVYPRELDFNLGVGKSFPPKDWYQVNCLIKENNNNVAQLQIPSDVLSLPGQLIYLEINCCANSDLNLMKRLIQLLSVSPNKFIVSKGPLHNRYELPHNMWGLQSLPQKEAIKASQLIITCGDTNTITEALFYGKPMIVIPFFGHHFDNSQRIKDNGFGVILHPYKCKLSTTFGSINAMLCDHTLHRKLKNISYKMQNSDQIKTLCALIENLNNK